MIKNGLRVVKGEVKVRLGKKKNKELFQSVK